MSEGTSPAGGAGVDVPGRPGGGVVEVVVEHLVLPGGGDDEFREAALAGSMMTAPNMPFARCSSTGGVPRWYK